MCSQAGIENLNQPVIIQQFTRSESMYHDTLTMTQEVKRYGVHSAIGPRSVLIFWGKSRGRVSGQAVHRKSFTLLGSLGRSQ